MPFVRPVYHGSGRNEQKGDRDQAADGVMDMRHTTSGGAIDFSWREVSWHALDFSWHGTRISAGTQDFGWHS
jgi:hypothetical protein